jgi:hypothetical protein
MKACAWTHGPIDKERYMRNFASIGLAIAALAATALPAAADDQSIGFATGTIGGTAPWAQAQTTRQSYGAMQRFTPVPYGGYPQYTDYAQYGEPAQNGGYAQGICTYSGGPKSSTSWTCQ